MSRDRIGLIFEPTQRHIRVEFNGEIVADSKRAMLLRESRYELHYLFPVEDVRQDFLVESDHVTHSAYKGDRKHWHVKVGYDDAENAAFQYAEVKNDRPDLTGYIGFEWDAMDAWYEEDEQVFLHPRDPYHRVDTLRSSRHIRVEIDGVTIAETRNPILLFETGIPVRYYIPEEDVQMDLLAPTELSTHCPYKGDASYWTATVNGETHENIVWSYKHPFDEIPKIKGLLSFYNEKVNIYVDGELEERPNTVFA